MFKKVLLAIDLAHQDEQQLAIDAAKVHLSDGDQLFVISVVPSLDGGGFVQSFLPADYAQSVTKKAQVALHAFTEKHFSETDKIKHLVVQGKVYERITDISKQFDVDLIITMASIKKDRQSSGFGPNVARIVRNSECSVLVLR